MIQFLKRLLSRLRKPRKNPEVGSLSWWCLTNDLPTCEGQIRSCNCTWHISKEDLNA